MLFNIFFVWILVWLVEVQYKAVSGLLKSVKKVPEVNGRREELTGPCKMRSYWTFLKASFQQAKEYPMNFNLKGARSRRIALKVLNKVKYFSVYYIRNSTCQALSPWLLCTGFCVDYWGTLYLVRNRGGGGFIKKYYNHTKQFFGVLSKNG